MKVNLDELREKIETLEGELRGYDKELRPKVNKSTGVNNVLENIVHFTKRVIEIKNLFEGDDGPTQVGFSDFFNEVGQSMLEAQRKLDDQSKEYVASAAGDDLILPSMFRIPRLTADMKFALERQGSEKLNLLFFSRTQGETVRNQQSIQFDIVSAPPAPEVLASLVDLVPRIELVLATAGRSDVFSAVGRIPDPKPIMERLLLEPANQPRVLIGRGEQGEERAVWFLLTVDSTVASRDIHLWELVVTPATGAVKLTVLSALKATKYDQLKAHLEVIISRQVALLNPER